MTPPLDSFREFDLDEVRDEIAAEVRRKRRSGDLSEELERALDRAFDLAPSAGATPEAVVKRAGVLGRVVRKVLQRLAFAPRELR